MAGDALSYLLVLARVAPVALALSVFSRGFFPMAVALSLALAWVAGLAPLAGAAPAPSALTFAFAMLRELCIGGAFALALAFALLAASWAVGMSRARDGGGAEPRAVHAALGVAYGLCAAWLVLSLGGARALFLGLAESFGDASLAGRALDARAFALGVARLSADALASAFGLALPLVASLWLLDVSSALIARALALHATPPAPLRPLLQLGAAALLLVPIASRAPELVRAAIAAARALTRAFAG